MYGPAVCCKGKASQRGTLGLAPMYQTYQKLSPSGTDPATLRQRCGNAAASLGRSCIEAGMGNAITAKIEASKVNSALTRKEKTVNREAVKELAAKHMEAAIKKLSEI